MMQQMHWDEDEPDILRGPASMEDVRQAMAKDGTRAVALHKPGSKVTMKDGTVYEVQDDGSWRKVGPEISTQERADQVEAAWRKGVTGDRDE